MIRITEPDGTIHTRDYTLGDVAVILAAGQQPQDAAERLARFTSGEPVKVGRMTWEMAG